MRRSIPPTIPKGLRKIYKEHWNGPTEGLGRDGLIHLLEVVRSSVRSVAAELEVSPALVTQVLRRERNSPKVRCAIAAALEPIGLGFKDIWGGAAPPPDLPPSELPGIPVFEGPFDPRRHHLGVAIDCETTGGTPARNALIELGLVAFVFEREAGGPARILGSRHFYTGLQDPGDAEVNPVAMRIHGIPLAEARGRELPISRILSLLTGVEFAVAHNANFDRGFVTRVIPELQRVPWYCTMRGLAWQSWGFENRKLKDLCGRFSVEGPGHRALQDAAAIVRLLLCQAPDAQTLLTHLLQAGPISSA